MELSDLTPPTRRLIAACLEYKAREFVLISATVYALAHHEPMADVEAVLRFLGLPSHYPR